MIKTLLDNAVIKWGKSWDVHELASHGIGFASSFLASHFAALTTTPDYKEFWAAWYLTAPQILNQAAFEKKLGLTLGLVWVAVSHFAWKFYAKLNQQAPVAAQPEVKP